MNAGIILAGGKSDEMGTKVDRAFLNLGSKPVLAYSVEAFEQCAAIHQVVVVVNKERVEAAQAVCRMFGCSKLLAVIAGGARRQQSVENALAQFDDDYSHVVVHEAARPCVYPFDIEHTIKTAKRYGSGVSAVPVHGSVKYCERGRRVSKSLEASKLWLTLSPQSFDIELLRKGLAAAKKKQMKVRDEAEAVELVSKEVRLVEPERPGVRIATVDDLSLAAALLKLA